MPHKPASAFAQLRRVWTSIGLVGDISLAHNRWFKTFWLLMTILLLAGCIHEIISLVTKYFKHPKATQITVVKGDAIFPAVSICSYSRIDKRLIEKYKLSDDFISFLSASFYGNYIAFGTERFNESYLQVLRGEHQHFIQQHLNGTWSTADFFLEHSMNCSDMFIYCQFEGIDFECLQHAERFLGSTGPCCELRSPIPRQRIPGAFGGFRIAVEVPDEAYTNTIFYSNPDKGYRVHIMPKPKPEQLPPIGGAGSDYADKTLTEASLLPVNVLPGSHAMISLHPIKYNFLQNSGACEDDTVLQYSKKYSLNSCIQECIVNLTLARCGCVQMGLLFVDRSLLCDPYMAASCVQPLYQVPNETTGMSLADEIQNSCECPFPCTYWDYPMNIGTTQVPNSGYKNKLKQNFPGTDVTSYSIIDIYYDNLIHTEYIEVETQTYTEFLSFFGGQMSLWLGIRIVTLLQLFIYGVQYLFVTIQAKKNPPEKKNANVGRAVQIDNISKITTQVFPAAPEVFSEPAVR